MNKKIAINKQLAILEELLVNEFRTCKSLQSIASNERSALVKGDVPKLNNLIEEKEVLLDQLGKIEDERRMVVYDLNQSLESKLNTPSVVGLLPQLDTITAGRLERLCNGISTVVEHVRQINNGNQALAASALERVDAVQNYLLSLVQMPANYQPSGTHPVREPIVVWDLDQKA